MPGLRLKKKSQTQRRSAPSLGAGIVSGILLWMAFPPLDAGWVAFVALVPLVHVFYRWGRGAFALASVAFGLTFFGFLLSWIRLFGLEAFIALIFLQTFLVNVVLLSGKAIAGRLRGISTLFIFPIAFVAAEYFRSRFPFGGFTWGGLGYSQHDFETLLRVSAFTGVWGISLLVSAVNVFLWKAAVTLTARPLTRSATWAVVCAVPLVIPLVLPNSAPRGEDVRIAIVQGNTQEDQLDPFADDFDVLQNHIRLTQTLRDDVDLVIWPESALDTDPFVNPAFGGPMVEAIRSRGSHFLIGASIEAGDRKFLNQSLFFGPQAELLGTYTKQHLVPFGEYVPYRSFFEPLVGPWVEELQLVSRDGIPGTESTIFRLPQGSVGSVICFESLFPGLVRSFVNGGAQLLVVSTNNSSFKRTAASDQHVAFSQLRAAEHRMWVVHAALTGISALVSPSGRVIERTELFVPATVVRTLSFTEGSTFYARTGDWLPIGSIGLLAIIGLAVAVGIRRSAPEPSLHEEKEEDVRPLVIIPTYREAENIQAIIDSVLHFVPLAHVLVVDDSSPDGTGSIVSGMEAVDDRVHLMSRPKKMGLGRAYIDGFRWGLERDFNRLVEMDADFSHDPEELPRLLAETSEVGLAIGSRYIPSGGIEGWSIYRHRLSQYGNIYARGMLGFGVRDSTSGFRCFRREALAGIDLSEVRSEGYAFQIDMAYRVWRLGFSIKEIPITFRERRLGGSKMSRAIVSEALIQVTAWGVRDFVLGRRFIRR